MPEVARCHVQQIERHHRVGFRDVFQAASFHQPYRRIDDRFGGEAVGCTVLQSENVAGQVERANLAAAVGKELVGANCTAPDLVYIVRGLRLSEDLGTFVVLKLAQDYACSRQLTELSQGLRSAAGMGVDVDKHGLPP